MATIEHVQRIHSVPHNYLFQKDNYIQTFKHLTTDWLAQLVEQQTTVREVYGSSPEPDQHSGS